MTSIQSRSLALLACVAGLALAGCASKPAGLYYWGDYQKQVYAELRSESGGGPEQIIALEKTVQQARSQSKPLPPGFHANLGLLYLGQGKIDQVVQEFETEKALFPEGASFMDFLLRKIKGEQKS
ncbi:DUF4810 domain-containing protein [Uliginosibacterium paludis]|uniref:DUF4810 domain-containing protein n=1 Tax=Uliginosibacterium paludis TaxID=1615952 RepID=A0ABV2CSC6_9RHOO